MNPLSAPRMSTAEARALFNQAIQQQPDADQRLALEICREYFTNPDFRKWLENCAAQINGVPSAAPACRTDELIEGEAIPRSETANGI